MISELLEHVTTSQDPERSEVLEVVKYLSALNSIFEKTLLGSKTRIFDPEGTGIQRLEEGFDYFREWAKELVDFREFEDGVESKKFIAWQVESCSVYMCWVGRAITIPVIIEGGGGGSGPEPGFWIQGGG